MTQLPVANVYQLLRAQGLAEGPAIVLTAIAGAESGYVLEAVGDRLLETAKWGPSIGLWQIRTLKAQTGTGKERDRRMLEGNATAQARSAVIIYKSEGLGAWSTYNNQAYRAFMSEARKAADGDDTAGQPSPGGAAAGAVGGVLYGAGKGLYAGGEAAFDAAGGVLTGIDAIGHFFGALGQRSTWVRVLQVVGGGLAVAGGLAMLGHDIARPALSAAADLTPAGRAAKAAGQLTDAAT